MAKGQHLTNHQKSIVNRYYAHLDTITLTKLQEAVSDLYLTPSGTNGEKASAGLWKSVRIALAKTEADPAQVERIVSDRDVTALAELVAKLGAPAR